MEFQRLVYLFLVLFSLVSVSQALKFNVGGSDRWVPNPSESYNQWAGRKRFQVNDTLVFKYKKGSESVLEVKKEDYGYLAYLAVGDHHVRVSWLLLKPFTIFVILTS